MEYTNAIGQDAQDFGYLDQDFNFPKIVSGPTGTADEGGHARRRAKYNTAVLSWTSAVVRRRQETKIRLK